MKLIDGVAMNKENPVTFEIPSDEEKAQIKKGTFIKLGFVVEETGVPSAERMWVRVTGKNQGVLTNDPVFVYMCFGDVVTFSPDNVLQILPTSH